jgi:hypothetical protein
LGVFGYIASAVLVKNLDSGIVERGGQ